MERSNVSPGDISSSDTDYNQNEDPVSTVNTSLKQAELVHRQCLKKPSEWIQQLQQAEYVAQQTLREEIRTAISSLELWEDLFKSDISEAFAKRKQLIEKRLSGIYALQNDLSKAMFTTMGRLRAVTDGKPVPFEEANNMLSVTSKIMEEIRGVEVLPTITFRRTEKEEGEDSRHDFGYLVTLDISPNDLMLLHPTHITLGRLRFTIQGQKTSYIKELQEALECSLQIDGKKTTEKVKPLHRQNYLEINLNVRSMKTYKLSVQLYHHHIVGSPFLFSPSSNRESQFYDDVDVDSSQLREDTLTEKYYPDSTSSQRPEVTVHGLGGTNHSCKKSQRRNWKLESESSVMMYDDDDDLDSPPLHGDLLEDVSSAEECSPVFTSSQRPETSLHSISGTNHSSTRSQRRNRKLEDEKYETSVMVEAEVFKRKKKLPKKVSPTHVPDKSADVEVKNPTLHKIRGEPVNDGNVADDEANFESKYIDAATPGRKVDLNRNSLYLGSSGMAQKSEGYLKEPVTGTEETDHAVVSPCTKGEAVGKCEITEVGSDKPRVARRSISLKTPLRKPRIPAALANVSGSSVGDDQGELKAESCSPTTKDLQEEEKALENIRSSLSSMDLDASHTITAPSLSAELIYQAYGPKSDSLTRPIGVAELPNGTVVVADTFNDRMGLFTESGKFVRYFRTNRLQRPSAIVVLPDGKYAVKDNHSITVFSSSGGSENVILTGLKRPYGLTVNANGELMTVQTTKEGYMVILVISPSTGMVVRQIKVQVCDPKESSRLLSKPRFISYHKDGRVLVVDLGLNCVYSVDLSSGKLLFTFGEQGSHAGEFNDPSGIACDSDGYILIGDSRNHRVQVFDSSGKFVCILDTNTRLCRPSGIYLTSDRFLYILNYWDNSLSKFNIVN